MKVHVAFMLAVMLASLIVSMPSEGASTSGSISVTLDEGNTGTIEVKRVDPCGNFSPEEIDVKKHWTMPTGITAVRASLDWDDATFFLDFGTGTGECPDNGIQLSHVNGTSCHLEIYFANGSEMQTGQWFVHIKVINCGEKRGANCNYTLTVTLISAPPAPVTLATPSGSAVSQFYIILSWSSSNIPNFGKYEVHMSTNPNFTPSQSTLVWTANYPTYNSYNVTGLNDDTVYHFRVRTYDNYGGYSDSNVVSVKTLVYIDLPPPKVTVSDAGDATDTSVTIKWTKCTESDFREYQLHMSRIYGFTPSSATLVQTLVDAQRERYTVTGLEPSTTYSFVVKVFDKAGFNSTSNYYNVTTLPPNTPPTAVISDISPSPAFRGDIVNFVGYGTDVDDGWAISEYLWTSSIDGIIGHSQVFSSNTLSSGTHTIAFKVRDNRGAWSEEVTRVLTIKEPVVPNQRPIAKIMGTTVRAFVGDEITLDATSSSDSDGNITGYRFEFGDGESIDWTQAGIAVHAYKEAGKYSAKVQVRDDDGAVSDWASMSVAITTRPNSSPSIAAGGVICALALVALSGILLRSRVR